jgi:maleylpyruvate isomerase
VTGRPEVSLGWLDVGTSLFFDTAAAIPDEDLTAPSLLTGWDRATLLAHVARNAGALSNLVGWARTGVESPMYADAADRAAGIATLAAEPAGSIRAELAASDASLRADLEAMADEAWAATVRTARGRPIPASEIPWMRNREVWVHALDLATGLTFAAVPAPVRLALLDDAAALMSVRPDAAGVRARDVDSAREWRLGPDAAEVVEASTVDLCAWVLGRPALSALAESWPPLPAWL